MTRTRDTLQPSADECVYRLGRALRMGRIIRGDWGHSFTLSILRHSKRPGWEPSEKQLTAMQSLLAGLSVPNTLIIDEADHDAA